MTEHEQDVHRLWHDQPREEQAMSIDDVRSKAAGFARKVRRRNIATGVLILLLIGIEAWQISVERQLLERVGDLLTIAGFVYLAYRFRGLGVEPMPAGLGRTTSVAFYRTQLARQRDAAAHPWGYLAVFIPGVALGLFADALDRDASQNMGVALFAVALFVTIAWIHRRSARRLQTEIDELD
jgi:hypothetical protein